MAKGRVCAKQNTHEIIQNETLSFKKIIVSGLGGCAECHLQCTANIRVVAAIGNLLGRPPREPSSRPLISSAMDGRAFLARLAPWLQFPCRRFQVSSFIQTLGNE